MNLPDGIANAEDRLGVSVRVHELLLAPLAELYGDSVCVEQAPAPEHGVVQYGFDHGEYRCAAAVQPLNDRAAIVWVTARLGRFHTEYGRALRWLACNREDNTVGLSVGHECLERRELWVACSRVTTPGDRAGVREMLLDVRSELSRLTVALGPWFPQSVEGARLHLLEKECAQSEDEAMLMLATFPRQFMSVLESDEAYAGRVEPAVHVMVNAWLARWSRVVEQVEKLAESAPDDEDSPERRTFLLSLKLVALGRLGRWLEVMQTAEELGALLADPREALLTHRAGALYGLGRYEEALALCRPAESDGNPRLWFWKSLAQARLGQVEEARESYCEYERIAGPDIIGREKLTELLPEE